MARPTKWTQELQDRFVQIIQSGNYRSVAASAVGIHPDTVNDWMKKKRKPYTGFSVAVRKAEADAQRMMVNAIVKAGAQGDWRAALEFLARKFPKEWAKKDFQGALGADGKPTDMPSGVLVVPGIMDEEEWVAAAQRYKLIQPRAEETDANHDQEFASPQQLESQRQEKAARKKRAKKVRKQFRKL